MVAQTSPVRRESASLLDWFAGMVVVAAALAAIGYVSNRVEFEAAAGLAAAAGYATGGWLLFRYGRHTNAPDGRAFSLLGVALMLGAIGMVTVGVAAEFTEVSAFGAFDSIFIAVYLMLLLSLALMPSVNLGWRSQARIILDGLVGAISVSVLIWNLAASSIVDNVSQLAPFQRAIGLTYPILDVALLIGIMVVVLRRGQYQFDVRLLAVLIAFAFQAGADLSFLSNATPGSFQEAEPNLLLFLASATSFVVAGLLARRTPAPIENPDRPTPLWSYALPYVAGAVMVLVHLTQSVVEHAGTALFEIAATTVMVLVIVRQSIAIQENRTKVEHERRALIASVSHELRTPLTSMIGFLTVLNEGGDSLSDTERTELADVVLDQANYMGRMVTDIVMLARDTPDEITLSESVVSVSALVSSVLDTLGTKSAEIEVTYDPDAWVRVDTDRVKQIIVNLLTNGIRYGSGRTKLVLDTARSDFGIEVHDNGPGVPKKYQQVIWERFERGSNEFNAVIPGTGLGLSIVDMIVKAHKGTVTYRTSELVGGACFAVKLPTRVIAGASTEPSVSSAWQPASARSH